MLSSTLSFVSFASLSSALAIQQRQDAGYYYMPVEFNQGANSRVTAQMAFGSADQTPIQVVMDTGSSNFWMWSPNATIHWGSQYLGVEGPCNATVPTPYNPSLSSTSTTYNHSSTYAYAGNAKIVRGSQYTNDTLHPLSSSSSIPNVQFALESYGLFRQLDDGSCRNIEYDKAILGLSPYTTTTAGPSFRQNLFESGLIASRTMSMWFSRFTTVGANSTGGVIFGGVDTSKFEGEVVEVQNVVTDQQIGIYVSKPNITFNGGETFTPDQDTTCLLDSGAHADYLPFDYISSLSDTFLNSTGGILTQYAGVVAYNGSCADIPDVNITYTFAGKEEGKSVSVDVPLRTYARGLQGYESSAGLCLLNLEIGECMFGAPFLAGAWVGLDDEGDRVWLARGGVSGEGDGVDEGSLKVFSAGEGFQDL